MEKSTRKMVFLIFAASAGLFLALHFFEAVKLVKAFFAICYPLLLGVLLALMLKAPMEFFENKPLKRLTEKRPRLSRAIALFLAYAVTFSSVLLFLWLIIPELSASLAKLLHRLPEIMQTLKSIFAKALATLNVDARFLDKFDDVVYSSIESAVKTVIKQAPDLLTLLKNAFAFFSDAFFATAFSGYLLYDKESMKELFFGRMCRFPTKSRWCGFGDFVSLLLEKFDHFFSGQVIEAGILGVLCFVGMLLLGIPYALLVSAVVAVTAVIPLLGAIIGTVPSLIIIMIESPIKAVVFLLFIVLLQLFEGNLIYPHIVGNKIDLPPFFVLLALVIGGGLFGVVGILLVVPLASALYARFVKKE